MNAKTLRNSILQFAVEGKLVSQNSHEASASELIEEIFREKQRLRVNSRLKMTKSLSPSVIEEKDVPFDLPSSWEWVKIGDVYYNHGQKKPDQDFQYIDVASVNNIRGVIKDDLEPISPDVAPSRARKIVSNGDVIYSTVRPYLQNIAIVSHDTENNYELIASTAFVVMKLIKVFNEYLYFVLKSPYFTQLVENQMQGVAYPAINERTFNSLLIPLPPLEEQYRIVNKIKELFLKVDEFENNHSFLQKLQDHFPLQLEKSILQYAIEGKLVDQDTSDEPASELLKRISEQKERMIKEKIIKKEKSLPPITEEEIPFDIPDTWEWVRLGEVISLLSGQDFSPENYNDTQNGIPYITGASTLSKDGVLLNRWTEVPRCIAKAGDLLLVCKGSGFGKTFICDIEEAHIARQLMSIKNTSLIDINYIKLFLDANINQIKKSGQGVIPGIDRQSILRMVFPLPPLEEQKKIVQVVDEIKNKVDHLK